MQDLSVAVCKHSIQRCNKQDGLLIVGSHSGNETQQSTKAEGAKGLYLIS